MSPVGLPIAPRTIASSTGSVNVTTADAAVAEGADVASAATAAVDAAHAVSPVEISIMIIAQNSLFKIASSCFYRSSIFFETRSPF